MIHILDWIFESMAQWVASIMTEVMDACSAIFLNALGTDMGAMEEYFPFVTKAFFIMQYTAWAVLLLVTVWQLFRVFGGPITEAENPLHLLFRSSIFALLIGYAKPIFNIILDLARGPYTALLDTSMDPGDFTFAGIRQVLESGMVSLTAYLSVVGLILIIILMIALGWNYFKLLLEVIERYILVGVMCYTSPLAFSMGGSKATNKVFQSWCRMVGAQLLMLIMNVWFLRAFNSSVGIFIATGGALSSGEGNIFLWLFCAIAFLKIAQKFDSYLASMGLNVAQTGGALGMEMMMAARVLGGGGGIMRSAGGVFKGSAGSSVAGAMGTAAGAGGFISGFTSKFKPNSFVRDAVVEGGSKVGAGGGLGMVARTFGGMAAKNGATLSGDSISTVAAKAPSVSGSIAGAIADRSLSNYMPHLAGKSFSDTKISGGRISTTATTADGKQAAVEMYSADQFEKPDMPHSVVTASDGSQWFQTANGAGMGEFYATPSFTGDSSESGLAMETFPGLADGTSLRSVDEGVIEATNANGSSMMYNSGFYEEPDAPHSTIQDANGVSWYAMQPNAATPFETADTISTGISGGADIAGGITGEIGTVIPPLVDGAADSAISASKPGIFKEGSDAGPDTGTSAGDGMAHVGTASGSSGIHGRSTVAGSTSGGATDSVSIPAMADSSVSGISDKTQLAAEFNKKQFHDFMPGYTEKISSVDASRRSDGIFEVRHDDGSGTRFYDTNQYQSPRGDFQVYEDKKGGQWYGIQGKPAVERQPVYQDGEPVYKGGKLETVNVESVKYSTSLTKFSNPKARDVNAKKTPGKKK